VPYTSGSGADGNCPIACTGSGEPTKYKCDDANKNFLSMEDDIKNAVM